MQDFKQFNEYLKEKRKEELNLLEQYYGDAEEYFKEIEKTNKSDKFYKYFKELEKEIKIDDESKFIDDFIEKNMGLDFEEFEKRFTEAYKAYKGYNRNYINMFS